MGTSGMPETFNFWNSGIEALRLHGFLSLRRGSVRLVVPVGLIILKFFILNR